MPRLAHEANYSSETFPGAIELTINFLHLKLLQLYRMAGEPYIKHNLPNISLHLQSAHSNCHNFGYTLLTADPKDHHAWIAGI